MIELITEVKNEEVLKKSVERFREKGIILPTFAQMRDPDLIPGKIKDKLKNIGLWDRDPLNLFRISWKNEPKVKGGGFGKVNYIEIPSSLTGVKARIVLLAGKWFPTGAHKVGAAYGCLAPRIISGQFDPMSHKAVWPSTGNYCRGGAFDSYLMGCTAVAILPAEMSKERFSWLRDIGAEVIATPGCESNVKEIYDECDNIRANRPDCVIFNQFDEFANPAWHYNVTAPAIEEVFKSLGKGHRLSAYVSATGSAGTIGAGDYLKKIYPNVKIVASEALQCPTLYMNGFGGHRIEGIGDKHVPWVHNTRNTDVVTAIDDEDCMRLFRLFNEPQGKAFLKDELKLDGATIENLSLLGISGVANLLSAIKTAKYFEMNEQDVICSLATDSAEMYGSRLEELNQSHGAYSVKQAGKDADTRLFGQKTDYIKELGYWDRKAIHNLKYYTWVEQQGKESEDLAALWDKPELWDALFAQTTRWDEMINDFNKKTGVLK